MFVYVVLHKDSGCFTLNFYRFVIPGVKVSAVKEYSIIEISSYDLIKYSRHT